MRSQAHAKESCKAKELMHYYIDGYNLLFCLSQDLQTFEKSREQLIDSLTHLKLSLTIVFDGKGVDTAQRSHKRVLEIVYTEQGQSADAYIVEEISRLKNPKNCTVVTSDKQLLMRCRQMGSYSQEIPAFLTMIQKKRIDTTQEKPSKDSEYELQRLLRVFKGLSNNE